MIEGFRLSPQQRRVWSAWEDAGEALRVECVLRLEGTVDAAALGAALETVVARHEALRTRFRRPSWARLPVQVVAAEPELRWHRLEVSDGEATAAALRAAAGCAGYDPAEDPPLTAVLAGTGDGHRLLLSLPALVADARSLSNLVAEMAAAYGGAGAPAEEPLQYARFAEWRHRLLEEAAESDGEDAATAAADDGARLPLGTRAEGARYEPGVVERSLTAGELAALNGLAQRLEVGPPAVVRAAWQALLGRLTQTPPTLHALHDGRKFDELAGAMGLFATYLPLSPPPSGLPFAELVAAVERAFEDAVLEQETFDPERVQARGDRVLFDDDAVPPPASTGGLRVTGAERSVHIDPCALRLAVLRDGDGLRLRHVYDRRRFDAATVERLAGWLHCLLAAATADPRRPVDRLPLLAEGERHALLHDHQGGAPAPPPATDLRRLFLDAARSHPRRVAFRHGDGELTFGALEDRGRRLAAALAARGAGPETPVAVVLERGPEIAVAVTGALLAGAPFAPLDPGQPRRRLAWMLEECGAVAVVTQRRLLDRLPDDGPPALALDAAELPAPAAELPPLEPANLAYVVFTSGSTGRPKGVMVEHRCAVDLLAALTTAVYADLPSPLRLSLNAPLAFDGALKQVMALFAGHALELVPEEVRLDGAALAAWIGEWAPDVFDCTPAQLAPLLDAGFAPGAGDPPARVLVGGDDLDAATWERLAADPAGRYWNVYGPSECTVDVTAQRVADSAEPAIGRPLPGARAHIVDGGLELLPAGIPGELVLGGPGVGRGYTGRPAATAARFVPDPFADTPGARLYRTGDVARRLADGRLRFLGRNDHQVKVRGVRIELGEIEAVLAEHPEVQRAAVVLERGGGSGDERLVAYWAPARPGSLAGRELQAFCRRRLPEYMVPAAVVGLHRMPLTRNGKVDRAALADAEPVEGGAAPAQPPRTPWEVALAELWRGLLGVDRVGAGDSFFDLGGHSLLATRLMSRVRRTFGVEMPLRALFEEPTLGALAGRIAAVAEAGTRPALPAVEPVSRDGELPLSFAQQRLWVVDRMNPGTAAYNVPAAVRLRGNLSVPALEAALHEIERRHEVLRTTFPARDGKPVQRIAPPARRPLTVIDLTALPERLREGAEERLVRRLSRRPFDLARGPLLRAALIRRAADHHLAVLTLHHVVADGWSGALLVRETAALYPAVLAGRPSPLPELEVQYADFAVWQRRVLRGEVLDGLVDHWRRRLAGVPDLLDLPTDRPRGAGGNLRGGMRVRRLDADTAASLTRLAGDRGATLFMVLLAAYQLLLGRWAGQDDVVVGTDVAGRDAVELEPLIGFFINLLVLRTRLRGEESFGALVERVRETTLDAFAHRDLPYEKLVEALRPARRDAPAPLIQALLVLQNTPGGELTLPGLRLEPLDLDAGGAKFEIALFVRRDDDGLGLAWNYDRDLFDAATIDRLADCFTELVERLARDPEIPVDELSRSIDAERKKTTMASSGRKEAKLKKFLRSEPAAVGERRLVDLEPPPDGKALPLTARPADGAEVDPVEWARAHRDEVEEKLRRHGAIRFRGFPLSRVEEFEAFASALCPDLFEEYGDLPQEGSSGRVYHSTPYPSDKWILFHNESSHMHRWPLKQFFFCLRPSAEGGETPLLDCRESLRALSAEIVGTLRDRGLLYVRNFTDGLDVSWQAFFRTDDRQAVERFCRDAGMDFEWRPDGGLRTRQRGLAVTRHPRTGDEVFFNQIQLHHPAALDPEVRESMAAVFGSDEMPRNVLYGDGSPIPADVVEEIGRVYEELAVEAPWQRGDVVMLDNMLTAHARKPFAGERKIVVAMGELTTLEEVRGAALSAG